MIGISEDLAPELTKQKIPKRYMPTAEELNFLEKRGITNELILGILARYNASAGADYVHSLLLRRTESDMADE